MLVLPSIHSFIQPTDHRPFPILTLAPIKRTFADVLIPDPCPSSYRSFNIRTPVRLNEIICLLRNGNYWQIIIIITSSVPIGLLLCTEETSLVRQVLSHTVGWPLWHYQLNHQHPSTSLPNNCNGWLVGSWSVDYTVSTPPAMIMVAGVFISPFRPLYFN